MKSIRIILASTLVALLLIGPADAGDVPVITGKLVSNGDMPLKGYPVIVTGNEVSMVALTNDTGQFQIGDLPKGNYTVKVANSGEVIVNIEIKSTNEKIPFWKFWKKPDTKESVQLGQINIARQSLISE